ncbi:MAG: MATE family efflux transporter [Anaeroplasmataceae bacterium]
MSDKEEEKIKYYEQKNKSLELKIQNLEGTQNKTHRILYKIKKYKSKVLMNEEWVKNIKEKGLKEAKHIMYSFRTENVASLYILDGEYKISISEKRIKKCEAKILSLNDKDNKQKKKESLERKINDLKKYITDISESNLKQANINKAMINSKRRRKMILTGNIMTTIIAICFPIAIYQLFNSLYTVFDQIVSAYISKEAQGAVSALAQVKNSISAFGAGLAAGGGVLVSRIFGSGDVKKARHASSNLLFMSIIVSGFLMLFLIPLSVPVMRLCQLSETKIAVGKTYFRLQLFELFFVSLNSVFIGLEKAKGNSKIVMKLNFTVMIIKILLTCLFVFGFDLKKIEYVEVATIIGQATLTVIGMIILFSRQNILRISIKMLIPKKEFVLEIFKLSIPIFFGKFVMNVGKVTVNALCQNYWDVVTDGLIVGTFGISNNLCGLITSPTNSFEEGQSSIVSQNVGARNMRRAWKVFVRTLLLSTSISLVGFVLLRFILIDQIVDLFTIGKSAADENYKNMIKEIFKYDSLSIIALGINAAVLGLLYGFGQTKLSFYLNLSRIGSRILFLMGMHKFYPNLSPTRCAGLSMALSNTIILLLSFVFLFIFLFKVKRKSYNGMYFTDKEPEFIEIEEV